MDADGDEGIQFEAGGFEGASMWRLGAGLLGVSLWAQLFWYPLAAEFLSGRAGLLYVSVYTLPTLALFVALIVDEPAGYLFFVPGSFVPGLVLLPGQDVGALLQVGRSLTLAGTLVGFLFAGALAARGDTTDTDEGERLDGDTRRVEGIYPHYTTLRIAILVVLFAVLVGAGIWDPTVTSAIAEHHGEGRVAAQVFIVVFGFFIWSVVAYTMFFVPAANLEYDIRKLSREIDALASDGGSVRWRLGMTVMAGVAAVLLAVAWQLFR